VTDQYDNQIFTLLSKLISSPQWKTGVGEEQFSAWAVLTRVHLSGFTFQGCEIWQISFPLLVENNTGEQKASYVAPHSQILLWVGGGTLTFWGVDVILFLWHVRFPACHIQFSLSKPERMWLWHECYVSQKKNPKPPKTRKAAHSKQVLESETTAWEQHTDLWPHKVAGYLATDVVSALKIASVGSKMKDN